MDLHEGRPAAICHANVLHPRKPLDLNKMTKQQLIEKVAAKTELKKSEVEVAVDSVDHDKTASCSCLVSKRKNFVSRARNTLLRSVFLSAWEVKR